MATTEKIKLVTLAALNAALSYLKGKVYSKTETDARISDEIAKIPAYELPAASADRLGGVKAGGTGIAISADGVISATGDASPNSVEWGVIKNVPDAAAAVKGVITENRVGEIAQGKVDALQLKTVNGQSIKGTGDIAIDLTLYKVVASLPSAGIDANKIYLVLDSTAPEGNRYKEYVYVDGKWELMGEYKAAVDLTPYLKTADFDTAKAAIDGRLDALEEADASVEYMDAAAGTALATEIFG